MASLAASEGSEAALTEVPAALDSIAQAVGQLEAALAALRRCHAAPDVGAEAAAGDGLQDSQARTVSFVECTESNQDEEPVVRKDNGTRSQSRSRSTPMIGLLSRRRVSMVVSIERRRFLCTEHCSEDESNDLTVEEVQEVKVCSDLPTQSTKVALTKDNCTFNPYSKLYCLYALLSLAVLSFDIVVLPVVVAWDITEQAWFQTMSLSAWCFWATDVVVTCNTGVHANGELVLTRRVIVAKYLRKGLLLDLFILLVDVLLFLLPVSVRGSSMIRAVKLLRLVRMSRAVRSGSLMHTVESYLDPLGGLRDGMDVLQSLAKNFGWILLVNHWLACLWYAVGRFFPSDTGDRWVSKFGDKQFQKGFSRSARPSMSAGFWYEYTTSLHWSLTQMTPGSMQVFPTNTPERVLNVACLLVGMMVFSTLISSLSAQMNEHVNRGRGRAQLLNTLGLFLKGHRVSRSMAANIERRIVEVMSRKQTRPVVMADVAALGYLPWTLRRQLVLEICQRELTPSLFRLWHAVDPSGFASLCMDAVEFRALSQDDVAFSVHSPCASAYIVTQGRLLYEFGSETPLNLSTGAQLTELALWAQWTYLGTATATEHTVLLCINADTFGAIATKNRMFRHLALDLGHACCKWAAENSRHLSDVLTLDTGVSTGLLRGASTLSMLHVAGSSRAPSTSQTISLFEVVLPTMSLASRLLAARVAAQLEQRRGAGSRSCGDLDQDHDQQMLTEVVEGKALYITSESGELVRIVLVQVLELRHCGRARLLHLGTQRNGRFEVQVKLPGARQLAGELGIAAINRVLNDKMPALADHITWGQVDVNVTFQKSKRSAIKTKYVKVTHQGFLDQDFTLDEVEWEPVETVKKVATTTPNTATSLDSLQLLALRQSDGAVGIYSWLMSKEVQHLQSPEGERELRAFFDGIRLLLPEHESTAEPQQEAGAEVELCCI